MICLHQGDAVNLRETPGTSGRLGMSECKPPMCVCFAGVSVVTVGGVLSNWWCSLVGRRCSET